MRESPRSGQGPGDRHQEPELLAISLPGLGERPEQLERSAEMVDRLLVRRRLARAPARAQIVADGLRRAPPRVAVARHRLGLAGDALGEVLLQGVGDPPVELPALALEQ